MYIGCYCSTLLLSIDTMPPSSISILEHSTSMITHYLSYITIATYIKSL